MLKLLLDVVFWLIATPLAFLLRYNGELPAGSYSLIVATTVVFAGAKLISSYLFDLPSRSWNKVAFKDVVAIFKAMASVGVIFSIALLWLGPSLGIPRSVPFVDGLITLFLMVASRGAARYWQENHLHSSLEPEAYKQVLIIGAGEAGTLVVREMLRHPEMGMEPVGFLDDDRRKTGQRFSTVPVLGVLDDLETVLRKQRVDEVLIAVPSASGEVIRNIVNRVVETRTGVKYRTIPGLYELVGNQVGINRIRDVEIEDLLRRPPVRLDTANILGYLEGQTVMVTGAGGSVGSELVRQICRFHPKELILFGHGENSIYALERELDHNWSHIRYHSVIAAIQNGTRLDDIFKRYRPQVIFHTSAHKHVPLMELNPEEAVFNNIIGSRNLAELALKYGVSHFVNISTDKAVNPASVMGASKRMVEYVVQSAAHRAKEGQIFASVRFGNVLGSRGSVIPVFKRQIRDGGPVTVTHPEMQRYFMTIPEASQLVLQASAQGKNGEVYILDMGEPVKIVDLARDLIKLSGLKPEVDIPIEFSGIRPGEKLFEELMTEEERSSATAHEKIFVAKAAPFGDAELERTIHNLQEAALHADHELIRQYLDGFIEGCRLSGVAILA